MIGLLSRIRAFCRDRTGNVAILTGLCALPLIGIMGFAVDYAVVLSNKAKLDAAADAASIAGITTAQAEILANSGITGTALSDGEAQAKKVFAANAGAISLGRNAPVLTVHVTRGKPTAQDLVATVSYTGSNSSSFGQIFNINSSNVTGATASTLSLRKYINIYLVVDISQSMGIAADSTAMSQLFSRTGCVFGCHVGPNSNESIAHTSGNYIQLRIDVVKSAITNLINQAQIASGSTATTNIGLYTMELSLNTLTSPTNDYTKLQGLAAQVDLGPDNDGNTRADTATQTALTSLAGLVPPSGDGSTAANPQNYVFILTDGTYDTYNPSCQPAGYSHCVGPYDGKWPAIVQLQHNATIGVIYTTYYPIYKNNDPTQGYDNSYSLLVAPIAAQILPGLQSCATGPTGTSQWFIEATSALDLTTALNTFLMQSLQSAHLTQ